MKVFWIPDNKLNATLESFFNGHIAAITTDTDQMQNGKFELVEMELFRNNICGTVFNTQFTSNLPKAKLLKETGRIKFGLYNYTDYWRNPITNVNQVIPDYYASKWTSAGVAVFANAVEGQTKPIRFPNHGQQMFDISNGDYGFDFVNGVMGSSNLSETIKWQESQIEVNQPYIGRMSSMSFRNGRNDSPLAFMSSFLGARNSNADYAGLTYSIEAPSLIRSEDINKDSTCRTWDAWYHLSEYPTLEAGITHAKTRLQEAINSNGWFTEFIHWHSVFDYKDTPKGVASGSDILTFNKVFGGYDSQIGSQDVWRAGYGEVLEYAYLKELIDSVGSFEKNGEIFVFYKVQDRFKDTFTNGLNNDVPEDCFDTPISIKISTIGTTLEGQNIICDEAKSIRKIDANTWILNVPYKMKIDEGVCIFKIKAGNGNYYSENRPTITQNGNVFTSDVPCRWVVWRKPTGSDWDSIRDVFRDNKLKSEITITPEIDYDYFVGAINEFEKSSLIEL